MRARKRDAGKRVLPVLLVLPLLTACSREPESAPLTAGGIASGPTSLVDVAKPLAEPGEADMRALAEAEVDEINRNGGLRLQVSGVQSPPIFMRLDDFRKTECRPYTKAYRCDGEVTYSYPGSDFPQETLSYSRRYQRDGQGNWTAD